MDLDIISGFLSPEIQFYTIFVLYIAVVIHGYHLMVLQRHSMKFIIVVSVSIHLR
jgi:hypothetical protein